MPSENANLIRQVLPSNVQRFIRKRWLQWLPWTLRRVRERTPNRVDESMALAEEIHAQQVVALWREGIKLSIIAHNRLDDPLMSAAEFRAKLRRAACRKAIFERIWERKRNANRQRESDQPTSQWDGTEGSAAPGLREAAVE